MNVWMSSSSLPLLQECGSSSEGSAMVFTTGGMSIGRYGRLGLLGSGEEEVVGELEICCLVRMERSLEMMGGGEVGMP